MNGGIRTMKLTRYNEDDVCSRSGRNIRMVVKRIAACLLLISLAGCYRQAEDSFAPSSVGGDTQLTPIDAATQIPVSMEPVLDITPTIAILVPTESDDEATETGSTSSGDAT